MTGRPAAPSGRDGVGFDEAAGWATSRPASGAPAAAGAGQAGGGAGTRRFPFHCTQIADGTRTVAVGTRVSFGVLAGRAGRWEAADIAAGG